MARDSLVEVFVAGLHDVLRQTEIDPEVEKAICDQINQTLPVRIEAQILELMSKLNQHVVPNGASDLQHSSSQATAIQDQISKFIHWKRQQINKSNLAEFMNSTSSTIDSCSRLDMRRINRSCQIKTAVVENWEGPLDKTTMHISSSEPNSKRQRLNNASDDGLANDALLHLAPHIPPLASVQSTCHITNQPALLAIEPDANGETTANSASSCVNPHALQPDNQTPDLNKTELYVIDQCLAPLESHLALRPRATSILERIKQVEDRIISIERDHPFLAFYHFNYHTANEELAGHTQCKIQFEREQAGNNEAMSANTAVKPAGRTTEHKTTNSKPLKEEQVYQKLCGIKKKILGPSTQL